MNYQLINNEKKNPVFQLRNDSTNWLRLTPAGPHSHRTKGYSCSFPITRTPLSRGGGGGGKKGYTPYLGYWLPGSIGVGVHMRPYQLKLVTHVGQEKLKGSPEYYQNLAIFFFFFFFFGGGGGHSAPLPPPPSPRLIHMFERPRNCYTGLWASYQLSSIGKYYYVTGHFWKGSNVSEITEFASSMLVRFCGSEKQRYGISSTPAMARTTLSTKLGFWSAFFLLVSAWAYRETVSTSNGTKERLRTGW